MDISELEEHLQHHTKILGDIKNLIHEVETQIEQQKENLNLLRGKISYDLSENITRLNHEIRGKKLALYGEENNMHPMEIIAKWLSSKIINGCVSGHIFNDLIICEYGNKFKINVRSGYDTLEAYISFVNLDTLISDIIYVSLMDDVRADNQSNNRVSVTNDYHHWRKI